MTQLLGHSHASLYTPQQTKCRTALPRQNIVALFACSNLLDTLHHEQYNHCVQEQPEIASAAEVMQLPSAITALRQLDAWRNQHRDHMHTDVMQAMEEASDDESVLAEGSQVNVTANAGSFSLALPERFCSSPTKEQSMKGEQQLEEQPRAQKQKGLLSLIKGALGRH